MSLADEVRARRGDPEDPFDQTAARREYSREARKRDTQRQRAYRDGHRGEHRAKYDGDSELQDLVDTGASDRSEGRRSPPARQSKPWYAKPAGKAKAAGVDVVSDGAGLLLGVFAYALVVNYLKGGTPQVRGWLAAKFVNKPYGATAAPSAPAAPVGPGPAFGTGNQAKPGAGPVLPNPGAGILSKPPIGTRVP